MKNTSELKTKDYYIRKLNAKVPDILKRIKSIDFAANLAKNYHSIVKEKSKDIFSSSCAFNGQGIYISLDYCHALWISCLVSITINDISQILSSSSLSELSQLFKEIVNINRVNPNTPGFKEAMYIQSTIAESVNLEKWISDIKEIKNNFVSYEQNERLSKKALYSLPHNGAYTYAVAFIILHEYGHYQLGHTSNHQKDNNQEKEADLFAFTELYSSYNNYNQKFTVVVGAICAIEGTALYDDFWGGKEGHPTVPERIEYILNNVDDDKIISKAKMLVSYLIRIWATMYGKDCPEGTDYDTMIKYIKNYIKTHETKFNKSWRRRELSDE